MKNKIVKSLSTQSLKKSQDNITKKDIKKWWKSLELKNKVGFIMIVSSLLIAFFPYGSDYSTLMNLGIMLKIETIQIIMGVFGFSFGIILFFDKSEWNHDDRE